MPKVKIRMCMECSEMKKIRGNKPLFLCTKYGKPCHTAYEGCEYNDDYKMIKGNSMKAVSNTI